MKTPAGRECPYYYEDFHRGRSVQECRLIGARRGSGDWNPADCRRCSVPDILWANASPDLRLAAVVHPGFLGIGRRVEVTAHCERHNAVVDDPFVGCEQCADKRPGLNAFFRDENGA